MRYLTALASAAEASRALPAGEWCNGNTAVFGTVILGSSPSSPAKLSLRFPLRRVRHALIMAGDRLAGNVVHAVSNPFLDSFYGAILYGVLEPLAETL